LQCSSRCICESATLTDRQHIYLYCKVDQDPSSCSPCPSNDGEDAACEGTDQSSFEETLVQIEDVSRNTTVQSILNIVGLRLSRLGFTALPRLSEAMI
jgi:hypothetical protein